MPAIRVSSVDYYSNEIETDNPEDQVFQTLATKPPGDVNTLIALPPSPEFHTGYTNRPGIEPVNGPPGIRKYFYNKIISL